MGKILVLIVLLGGLYYIYDNYQSISFDDATEHVKNSVQNAAPISAVRDGRMKRQKEIMDATSF